VAFLAALELWLHYDAAHSDDAPPSLPGARR
jgi:hypothetical protein